MNNPSRRHFLALSAAVVAAGPAVALSDSEAKSLVDKVVKEINGVINSGKSQSGMIADFERIFVRYADVNTIARSTLGADARSASKAQLAAYTKAFRGYISRKYGKRFREFVGGRIEVQSARKVKSFYEVKTLTTLKGSSPFELNFLVSDRSGKDLFFDMVIEGISLRLSERTEIGSMLDRRKGNLDQLIADLNKAG